MKISLFYYSAPLKENWNGSPEIAMRLLYWATSQQKCHRLQKQWRAVGRGENGRGGDSGHPSKPIRRLTSNQNLLLKDSYRFKLGASIKEFHRRLPAHPQVHVLQWTATEMWMLLLYQLVYRSLLNYRRIKPLAYNTTTCGSNNGYYNAGGNAK